MIRFVSPILFEVNHLHVLNDCYGHMLYFCTFDLHLDTIVIDKSYFVYGMISDETRVWPIKL